LNRWNKDHRVEQELQRLRNSLGEEESLAHRSTLRLAVPARDLLLLGPTGPVCFASNWQ
jgi:hypothetical protein